MHYTFSNSKNKRDGFETTQKKEETISSKILIQSNSYGFETTQKKEVLGLITSVFGFPPLFLFGFMLIVIAADESMWKIM